MGFEVQDRKDGYLVNFTTASGASQIIDNRNGANFAFLAYGCFSPSAILKLEASYNGSGWLPVLTVTALPASGSAQISAYYPYVRGVVNASYASTGSAWMYFVPGSVG